MRAINEIIVHCTATQPKWMDGHSTREKVAEVRQWHMRDRGWKDIGYHFLIDRDGTLAEGRPLDQVGAHTQGHNTGTIGVSLFGGFGSSATDKFFENFTPEQDKALRALIAKLCDTYKIKKVSGHNEYASKACPGFAVTKWFGKT
jgi:N-acetyl-anhydromuramyl-L-alanine amidase AmpD